MKSYLNTYLDNFRGFSKEIWVLTLITYINRAGAMVMLFLTKYLHESLFFNLTEIGWMLVCIGVGALLGNWLGGKLTDKIGFYTVMLASLFLTGFGILSLMFLYDFVEICVGLFLVTVVADMYKPAMYVSVSNFTNKKNRTRALTLVRLAVNLGIISGPVIAGLVIQRNNYDMLFWIDGITCLLAISIFMLLIDESKIDKARRIIKSKRKKEQKIAPVSILKDTNFIIFLFASFLTACLFFQLFTTIPFYNSEKLKLTEMQIGLLLSFNGLLVFLLEMPLIGFLENRNTNPTKVILFGAGFMTSGFFFLLLSNSIFIIVISILLITVGQILLFSFSNSFAITRAVSGHEGRYMAFYAMSFSAAQILSPKVGFSVINNFNYFSNWLLMGIIGLIGVSLYYLLDKNIKQETLISKDLEQNLI